MEKVILRPQQCMELKPYWPELQKKKLKQLFRMNTRKSIFDSEIDVMSPVGIVIMNDNYILNGKHRAVLSGLCGYNLEAYVVENKHDITCHLPHESYGETGKMGLIEALDKKNFLTSFCEHEGVSSIDSLIRKYFPKKS